MARPQKCRRICTKPCCNHFAPQKGEQGQVKLALDEYETLRLIDYQGYIQKQCADEMGVARTTIQAIYAKARVTVATALVEGKGLVIDGGQVFFADDNHCHCGRGCHKNEKDDIEK